MTSVSITLIRKLCTVLKNIFKFLVSAGSDICTRFPNSALCQQGSNAPSPAPGPAPAPAVTPPPPPPPPPPPAPAAAPVPAPAPGPVPSVPDPQAKNTMDTETYCKQFLPNYRYFCTGPGSGDTRLGDFCPSFAKICGIPTPTSQAGPGAGGPSGPGAGIGAVPVQQPPNYGTPQLCYQYQYLAQSSCTYPNSENANTRYYCNYYRQFCQGTQVAPGIIPAGVPTPADPRCGPYLKQ